MCGYITHDLIPPVTEVAVDIRSKYSPGCNKKEVAAVSLNGISGKQEKC
jgi:hypothetical protein